MTSAPEQEEQQAPAKDHVCSQCSRVFPTAAKLTEHTYRSHP